MTLDIKIIAALIIAAGGGIAAGYYAGTSKDETSVQAMATAAPEPASPKATPTREIAPARVDAHDTAPYHSMQSARLAPNENTASNPPPLSGRAHLGRKAGPDAKFTHFRVGNRNVKQLMADGDLMWVGTSGGVIRYNIETDDYRLFDLRSGLLANGVFHLSKMDDRLVVGTYGGGLSIYNDEREAWDSYNIPHGLGDAFVYDVLESANGDIWIATWSGVNRVRRGKLDDREQWELYTVQNTEGGLPNDWVYGLANGKNGEVWMATEGGLARYKDGAWSNWNHKDGLGAAYDAVKHQLQFRNDPAEYSKHHTRQKTEMDLEDVDVAYNPNYIVALEIDRNGIVWAGTWGGGLARFDGESWRNYTVSDGLPANHVFSLYQDPQERLWVGTSKGLALMEGDAFKTYGMEDGLFSEIVFAMTTAQDGSAWIGSYGGVARIAKLP